ncbi:TetR/AcrR family transcriptional regulator [Arthrobacter psychrolactophilus]
MSQNTRTYVSRLREGNAEATRLRIADATRELMLERGYAATTMAEIARSAGVAVQTLYSTCPGGKPALARLVHDVSLAGDARSVALADRPDVQGIVAEPDPAKKLALYAAMATGMFQRADPFQRVLQEAAVSDPVMRELLASTERQRLEGSEGPAEHLAEIGALRDGLSIDRARDQIYALTSFELFDRFVHTCGWTIPEFEEWLTRTLHAVLLAPRTQ